MVGLIILAVVTILAVMWVQGIDYMKENHPDYKGEDLFGEDNKNE